MCLLWQPCYPNKLITGKTPGKQTMIFSHPPSRFKYSFSKFSLAFRCFKLESWLQNFNCLFFWTKMAPIKLSSAELICLLWLSTSVGLRRFVSLLRISCVFNELHAPLGTSHLHVLLGWQTLDGTSSVCCLTSLCSCCASSALGPDFHVGIFSKSDVKLTFSVGMEGWGDDMKNCSTISCGIPNLFIRVLLRKRLD